MIENACCVNKSSHKGKMFFYLALLWCAKNIMISASLRKNPFIQEISTSQAGATHSGLAEYHKRPKSFVGCNGCDRYSIVQLTVHIKNNISDPVSLLCLVNLLMPHERSGVGLRSCVGAPVLEYQRNDKPLDDKTNMRFSLFIVLGMDH